MRRYELSEQSLRAPAAAPRKLRDEFRVVQVEETDQRVRCGDRNGRPAISLQLDESITVLPVRQTRDRTCNRRLTSQIRHGQPFERALETLNLGGIDREVA